MGFWLDMVFGKSPLQSELDVIHDKVERHYGEFNSTRSDVTADREVLTQVIEHVTLQTEMNADVHEALEKIADNATDNAGFALKAAEEITKIKGRLDLLEANVVVHKRVKMKPVKGGTTKAPWEGID